MQIKNADKSYAQKIYKIEIQTFEHPLDLSFIVQELTNNPFARYFIVEIESDMIGYIGYRVVDEHAEMMNFAILKTHQNKGYGKKLLIESLEQLKHMHVKRVTLEVRQTNLHAIHLYKSLLFKKISTRKGYYMNEDADIYMKEII